MVSRHCILRASLNHAQELKALRWLYVCACFAKHKQFTFLDLFAKAAPTFKPALLALPLCLPMVSGKQVCFCREINSQCRSRSKAVGDDQYKLQENLRQCIAQGQARLLWTRHLPSYNLLYKFSFWAGYHLLTTWQLPGSCPAPMAAPAPCHFDYSHLAILKMLAKVK